ncbi:hypothetical protein QFC19_001897 [Naganishia cerealis]|uniref:Uncharacterized protein n=1 Tax=Naganishia cerealis TaxID=610337 RepID=A0ACC2WFS0_9TREE|nr:hypothetical protein QFC19_001897 [Naganishia cerealis]
MSLSSSSTGTITAMTTADKTPTTTTTMGKKLTPGRRGEKRKRPTEQQVAQDDERRRRAGKITAAAEPQYRHHSPGIRDSLAVSDVDQQPQDRLQSTAVVVAVAADDDDIGVLDNVEGIFSHRGRIDESSGNVDLHNTSTQRAPSSSSRSGMPSTDEWQAKNKASIKKRLLASLEVRRCGRDHPEFKEVFSVANKGACFALRNTIAAEPLDRDLIDKIVQAHLDLYLPVQDVISLIDERPPMRSAALPLVDTTLPSPGTDPSTDVVTIDILNDPDTTII